MRRSERTAYRQAMVIGERVWGLVEAWPAFERGALGRPLVSAVDAVGAVLGGALGAASAGTVRARRCEAARVALREAEAWLAKAFRRGLIPADVHGTLQRDVALLARHLTRRRPATALLLPPPAPRPHAPRPRAPRRPRRPP